MHVSILSYDEASRTLGSIKALRFTHVISINGPDTQPPAPLQDHDGEHLVLHFWDAVEGDGSPGRDHVQAIIDFAKTMTQDSVLLCHCAAGISRSSAAALTVIASQMEPTALNAMKAVQDVRDIKGTVWPNALMVQWADELLGFDGALVGVHSTTFKGSGLLSWISSLD